VTDDLQSNDLQSDDLQPNDLREGATVRVEWSPRGNANVGPGDAAEGEVTRVWRPDDDVQEFTVQSDGFAINVYSDYRNPVVERVEGGKKNGGAGENAENDDTDPERETVGRLDCITPVTE
jgi:hypothetical protein